MSADSADLKAIAKQAEQDLNSNAAKQGASTTDSATESGVNEPDQSRFPGATVTYGSAASGQGDNREIPDEEGGGINPETGRQTKAKDFEGAGGPEDKAAQAAEARGGDNDVTVNTKNKN